MDKCFECGSASAVALSHRYCDCRPDKICNRCFGPHTDECPAYGTGLQPDPDGDLGVE